MKKYFIDTENIGNIWVDFLEQNKDSLFYVFYTGRSANIPYSVISLIIENCDYIRFIECKEGNNALDFQLSTELGFSIANDSDSEYIIVSKDSGYDSVVDYWTCRGVSLSRFYDLSLESSKDSDISIIDEEAKELLYIIGKDNLPQLQESLVLIYGEKKGQSLFSSFKIKNSFANFLKKHDKMDTTEKQKKYCEILFANEPTLRVVPDDFYRFAIDTWRKKQNLNVFKSLLKHEYGIENGKELYDVFKGHIRIIDKIR